ncbi:MAG: molybdate ABC transporter substrate-binding protein [Rhodobacteraceae bacterium]|nr:molybdate ABC transporter substrate-binding protein [Paracoccaceae bacterium]
MSKPKSFVARLPLAVLLTVAAIAMPFQVVRAADPPLVFAAASLTDVAVALADDYAARGFPRPVFAHAASSALARQIEHGAPANIFISADEQWMDYLQARDRVVAGTRADMVGNSLVLIAPRTRPITIEIRPGFDLAGALGDGLLAIADPSAVPAGRYAQAALEAMGAWPSLKDRLVRADNVRSALAFVERGEVPAGIVYGTDAAASDRVAVAGTFPAASHPPIVYPMAIIAGRDTAPARSLLDYLRSDAARAIYRHFGFTAL